MTEKEWLAAGDPMPMLEFLRGKTSERKKRLFALACCYKIIHLIPNEEAKKAVGVAERIAEGDPSAVRDDEFTVEVFGIAFGYTGGFPMRHDRMIAFHATYAAYDLLPPVLPPTDESGILPPSLVPFSDRAWGFALSSHSQPDLLHTPIQVAKTVASGHRVSDEDPFQEEVVVRELKAQVPLLRDVFGNPFRPISINPIWLTSTVTNLAQTAYDERILPSGELDPARLAILSDALEEAGCDNAEILNHLRGAGPHVRGCWVLDLLLAKE